MLPIFGIPFFVMTLMFLLDGLVLGEAAIIGSERGRTVEFDERNSSLADKGILDSHKFSFTASQTGVFICRFAILLLFFLSLRRFLMGLTGTS